MPAARCIFHTVGSAKEPRRAVDASVDVVVGARLGGRGRVRGEVAALPLVPAVVDAVRPEPVIAAGGVADRSGLAAALLLGADAPWVGTRFLLAQEASVHDEWRARIRAAVSAAVGKLRRDSPISRRWPFSALLDASRHLGRRPGDGCFGLR
jgi:NAD(P)H-dependent flavin oxidoreductase YrpB (nitropropane dioxygenase family)